MRRGRRTDRGARERDTRGRGVRGCDRGAATVVVLGVVLGLVALMLAVATGVGRVVAHARAGAAADLAALAAATALVGGLPESAACERAHVVAARNDADVRACSAQRGDVVLVEAGVPAPFGAVHAAARAGPRPP